MKKIIKNKEMLVYEFLNQQFKENHKMPMVERVAKHFGLTQARVYQLYEILAVKGLIERPKPWRLKVVDIVRVGSTKVKNFKF